MNAHILVDPSVELDDATLVREAARRMRHLTGETVDVTVRHRPLRHWGDVMLVIDGARA